MDAERMHVVAEELSELVVRDLTDEGSPPAIGGDARGGIAGAAAGERAASMPIWSKSRSASLPSISRIAPFTRPSRTRKSSSVCARTSTIAFPIVSTSNFASAMHPRSMKDAWALSGSRPDWQTWRGALSPRAAISMKPRR